MHEIKAIIRPDRRDRVLDPLRQIPDEFGEVTMTKLEVVVPDTMLGEALETIRRVACTGQPGDGKVFVLPVEQAMKIRSHTQGVDAL